MPIPAGQSCANCQFFGTTGRLRSFCLYDPPSLLRNLDSDSLPPVPIPPWRRVGNDWWCGKWAGSSGTSGLQGSDVGVGYRGTSVTGDVISLTPTFSLLAPSFAAITNTLNFTLTSPGVLTLNYTTYTPSPTFAIYVTVMGVVVLRSSTNNQAFAVTIAQNGTPETVYEVPADVKTTGAAVPIPVAAGLSMKNGDTVSLFAKDTSSGAADLISFHMLLEGFRVITY